jgi:ABC-2 type transport system ATP-binding protein
VTSALAFESASKRYRNGVLALDAVSFSIEEGARTCLLGPNGAGKSTAIRLLQGALRPTQGRVSLLGATLDDPRYAEARRRTGIVPQRPGMYPDVTVDEYLTLARRLYGRGDLDATIEAFGLGRHRSKTLANLSGGFQRRVVLAAALLSQPDVLLLDEPTVGLDPVASHDVEAMLRDAMRGRTTLLCTHDLAEAEALCDDVIILREGKVLLHQPISMLRESVTAHVRVQARSAEELRGALARRGLSWTDDGDAVVLALDASRDMPDLLRGLLAEGVDVYACTPLNVTLEALFLEAVRQ